MAHPEDKYKIEKNAHHHIIDKTLGRVKVSEENSKKQVRNAWPEFKTFSLSTNKRTYVDS